MRCSIAVALGVCVFVSLGWAQTNSHFPLQAGNRWTLRHGSGATFVFEVSSSSSGTADLVSTGPWGATVLRFTESGNQYLLTGYGPPGGLQTISPGLPFFDFGGGSSLTWSNAMGSFSATKIAPVSQAGYAYVDCLRIVHTAGGAAFTYVFSPNIGLVEYKIGPESFALDASASRLTRNGVLVEPWVMQSTPPLGVLPNPLANRADTRTQAANRMNMIGGAGFKFLLSYGNWPELEPATGQFAVDSIKYIVTEANKRNWQLAYTLTLIDMDRRRLPGDLANRAWDDPEMERRVLALIDRIATEFGGRVKWVQFGNEVDTYFKLKPAEVAAFARLFAMAKARLQQRVPGIQVSVTMKFEAMPVLATTYRPIDLLCDHLALTYSPHTIDYRALDPNSIGADFASVLTAAGNRRVLFQEFAYPSAAEIGSSPAVQAEAMRRLVRQLRMVGSRIAAAQVFKLADMSPSVLTNTVYALGMQSVPNFAPYLGTVGLYDEFGIAKPAWAAISAEMAR